MGVTGLWRLVEPTGKPVPVETLENKVLAVDISIWLHQVVKGYQDAKGAPLPNAHLMGLFQRLCKLLYFRIKPVFVFDGAFPDLKKETIAKRQDNKTRYQSESERLKRELALLLSKKTAVSSFLQKEISPKKPSRSEAGPSRNDDDIFKLPELPAKETESESESEEETSSTSSSGIDLHTVDLESDKFKTLPVKEKYDLLIELKETRKMNSWGRLHELPKQSDNFSDFQMQRLLKRKKVQQCIEETEKEIGSTGMSLNEIETLLNEEGIDTKIDSLPTRRIASNENTGYLFVTRNMKVNPKLQSIKENAEKACSSGNKQMNSNSKIDDVVKPVKADELEDDLQKAIQMSLECVDEPNTSNAVSKTDHSWTSFMTDSDYSNQDSDSEEEDGFEQPDLTTAKAYIMQYSDFTHKAIKDIVTKRKPGTRKKAPNVDQILEELNKEKSIIAAEVDLSSDEDNLKENTVKPKIKEEIDVGDDQSSDIINLNTTNDDSCDSLPDDLMTDTQASVLAIEEPHEIITLDTSTEESVSKTEDINTKENNDLVQTIKQESISESDTTDDDDDFEEVTDENEVQRKPVVELNLEMGKAPEDDIFADIFAYQASTKSKLASKEEEIVANGEEDLKEISESVKTDEKSVPNNVPAPVKESNPDEIKNKENTNEKAEQNVDDEQKTVKENLKESTSQSISDNIVDQTEIQFKKPADITPKPIDPISVAKLNTMVEDIESEERDLIKEKGRLDRIGRNITEQMTKEAQELLQVFGIPYIVAPMEAEAQCAFLELVKLTDGTITDDSDIWLFGGQTVYKNFFNQKKHVLQFLSERIEKSFNLTREQLILLALLVGSDYTTGLSGVGPVTALEILASFPHKKLTTESNNHEKYIKLIEGLTDFKKWVRSGKRTDNTSLKKKLKNVTVTDDFPSVRVVQAYLEPNVEKSEEKFSWGELDVTVLRDYTKAKFGWSQTKLDEIIKPVIKRMNEKQSQKKLQDFFKRKVDFSSLEDQMSKRVKAAVRKMGPELPFTEEESVATTKDKKPRKRKVVNKPNATEIGESSNKKIALPKELLSNVLKVKTIEGDEKKSMVDLKINKSDRYQEVIPQREKDKHGLLQNKMKAIEIFRKTKLDTKRQTRKRRVNLPKEKAELSESSDSD